MSNRLEDSIKIEIAKASYEIEKHSKYTILREKLNTYIIPDLQKAKKNIDDARENLEKNYESTESSKKIEELIEKQNVISSILNNLSRNVVPELNTEISKIDIPKLESDIKKYNSMLN